MATTRNQKRVKTFAMYIKNQDETQRNLKTQSRLDVLESDYYDSPNKLAEEELSDTSMNKKKSRMLRIAKKKQNDALRKNVNLKKMLKNTPETEFLNFQNITPKAETQKTKQCSICRSLAKYTCPKCLERYCCLDCHQTHKEIQCLRFDLQNFQSCTRNQFNCSNTELQKYQEHGLYSFILSHNRAKDRIQKKQKQQISPIKKNRPSTAIADSMNKTKVQINFALNNDNYHTLQPKFIEDNIKNIHNNQSQSTPHQKLFVYDQKIMKAMSSLKKIRNQRIFRPCPFTLGINIEQCQIKPKDKKQRSISQLQQCKSLNKTDILRFKRYETPMSVPKTNKFSQFSKWEQYDDSNLFDLNFLNGNVINEL